MSTFLEVHVIQNLPPSNINRDDTGAPKSAMYGGTNRLRVSSQAWKRATRMQFAEEIEPAQRATRTLRIVRLVAEKILELSPMEEDAAAQLAIEALKAAGVQVKAKKVKAGDEERLIDSQAEALFFISAQQVAALAELAVASGGAAIDKKAAKAALDTKHGIEIALFGRMSASVPDLNVDAAVQVAHAISTHAIDPQGDFYTAVDDEKTDDEDAGAGMMGTIEFASATLYRYAAVALDQLQENLGDDATPAEACAAFVKGFATSLPSGKKNSMAADTLPACVVVMLRENRPVSLVDGFENPVKNSDEGFVAQSVQRLRQAAEATATFGLAPERTWVVASPALAESLAGLGDVASLPEVVEQVRTAVTAAVSRDS